MNTSPEGWAVVSRGAIRPIQEMRDKLADAGIEGQLVSPDDCKGCSPQAWLVVPQALADSAAKLIQEQLDASLDPEARAAADSVADFDGDTVTCPACGAQFASTFRRCPDCDLNFG